MANKVTNLEQLLDRLDEARQGQETVSLGQLMDHIGRRSFGPLLLLIGVMLVSPLSGIPGLPSTMGVAVLLLSLQMVLRRKYIWLPGWILRRNISQQKLAKSARWLRRPARFVDRFLRERLSFVVDGPASWPLALVCLALAVTLPLLEPVPFAASSAGLALTCIGLAMISHDGVLALIAYAVVLGVAGLIAYNFL
ncbi:MAG: exopolysaccharide biosynthesis protein [Pseudomonas sp.]